MTDTSGSEAGAYWRSAAYWVAVLTLCLAMPAGCLSSCGGCRRTERIAPAVGVPGAQTPLAPMLAPGAQTPLSPMPAPGAQTPFTPMPAPGAQTPFTPMPAPGAQTPLAPMPAPIAQSPVAPMPAPRPGGVSPKASIEEPPALTAERLEQLQEGMSFDEVMHLVGRPEVLVAQRGDDSLIYRWSQDGTSLLGRFEKGVLVRKSVQAAPDAAPAEGEPRRITHEQYEEVQEGMTLDEVLALLDVEGRPVSQSSESVFIYKWTDDMGSSFTARFEDGVLVRKTGLHIAALPKEDKKTPVPTPTGAVETVAEETATAEPMSEAVAEDMPPQPVRRPRRDVDWEAYVREEAPPAMPPEPEAAYEKIPQQTVPPRVTVARGDRRSRENSQLPPELQGRSYRPKARLPDYTYSLRRGVYEVRVHNAGDSAVQVGLRAERRGLDARIPPGGTRSFHVDRGNYAVYYIYDSAPYTLRQGSTLAIDGMFMADLSLTIFDTPGGEAP